MFFGTFCSMKNSMDSSPTPINSVKDIEIKNGIFDDVYLTKEINSEYTNEVPTIWDFDTALHSPFNGDLFAGNTDFSVNTVSDLRVKRRKKGTQKWTTIYSKEITKKEDFLLTGVDNFVAATEYDYAIVPVMDEVEGNYNINSIDVQFEGLFIVDRNKLYKTLLNIEHITPKRQKPSSIKIPIDRKYPFVISSKETNFYSGKITATFFEKDNDYGWKIKNSWEYRDKLKDWLYDGVPKILKYDDGRMWIISIVGDIDESTDGHEDNVKTTFEFVETGDANSNKDLYKNGLIKFYVEGE